MAFAKQHPNLTVEINFNTSMVNFIEDGFDFAIRYGRLSDSGLVARKLVDRPMQPQPVSVISMNMVCQRTPSNSSVIAASSPTKTFGCLKKTASR